MRIQAGLQLKGFYLKTFGESFEEETEISFESRWVQLKQEAQSKIIILNY